MIIMQDVRKKYGDYEFRMSMEIPHGRITGLVGKTVQEKVRRSS